MEPNTPNPGDEDEMMRRLRSLEGAPPEEKGLPKSRKMLIAALGVGVLLLVALMLFLMGGKKVEKQSKVVPTVNRGLLQAEVIRQQKDLLDPKNRAKEGEESDWLKGMQTTTRNPAKASDTPEAMPDPVSLFPTSGTPVDSIRAMSPSHEPMPDAGRPWKNPLPFGGNTAPSGSLPEKPADFKPDTRLSERMSDEYQKALAFNASEQLVFTRDRLREEGTKGPSGLKGTAGGSSAQSLSKKVIISAGQELTAVLNEALNSDYPSVAKATVTSPPELSGSTVLLSYALGQERVSAQVLKLIFPAKEGERAREQSLAAVVKSGLPGLAGDVSHHWLPQIAAGVANAGLTAGALAYAAQNESKDLGTAMLVAPMIQQSVEGVMKPINYLGRDRPVTVQVPPGTEFTLLVTEGFEVDL